MSSAAEPFPEFEYSIESYRCFSAPDSAKVTLGPGITAFVGENNAGKSALLRSFFDLRPLLAGASSLSNWKSLSEGNSTLSHSLPDLQEILTDGTRGPLVLALAVPDQQRREIGALRLQLLPDGKVSMALPANIGPANFLKDGTLDLAGMGIHSTDRLCRIAGALANSLYLGAFRNAINIGGNSDYFDARIGERFIRTWSQWEIGSNREQNRQVRAVTRDIQRLLGFGHFEIRAGHGHQSLQVDVEGHPRRIDEVGSGISQAILAFGNAIFRSPSFILIDEPELGLHPKLQMDFLLSLASYAEHGVLFATHSYGLARACADRIYLVRREGNRSVIRSVEEEPRLSQALATMQYPALRLQGATMVLLVEGPTELKVIRELLRLLDRHRNCVLLQLGGRSLIRGGVEEELAELKHICGPRVAALVDSERKQEGAEPIEEVQAFAGICQKLAIRCHVLDRRSTEHYFPDRVVKSVVGQQARALQPFEPRGSVPAMWPKHLNWRLASAMTPEELLATDLGQFLQHLE